MSFEHVDKKIKFPQKNKLAKEQDDIFAEVYRVINSNETVSISSPQLEAQVKKEFNPEKSKIVPQHSPLPLQLGPKISCEDACHDLHMTEQSTHNDHYLAEDISLDEQKIFLNIVLIVLVLLISNVAGLGDSQILACVRHALDQISTTKETIVGKSLR